MSTREFVCFSCGQWWQDEYSFWRGYCSPCPACGKDCPAFCDTEVFADQEEMGGNGLLANVDDNEGIEADLEAEGSRTHGEIIQARGPAEVNTTDIEDDGDADEDADGDVAHGGDF